MKLLETRIVKRVIALACVLAMTLALCPQISFADGISLINSETGEVVAGSVQLEVNGTMSLKALDDDGIEVTATWSSDDAEVFTVNDGEVSAVANGTATLTVENNDASKSAEIQVIVGTGKKDPKPLTISFNGTITKESDGNTSVKSDIDNDLAITEEIGSDKVSVVCDESKLSYASYIPGDSIAISGWENALSLSGVDADKYIIDKYPFGVTGSITNILLNDGAPIFATNDGLELGDKSVHFNGVEVADKYWFNNTLEIATEDKDNFEILKNHGVIELSNSTPDEQADPINLIIKNSSNIYYEANLNYYSDQIGPKISFNISDYSPKYDSTKTPLYYFGQTKKIGVSVSDSESGLKKTQYAFLTSNEVAGLRGKYEEIDNDRFINNDAAFEDGKYNFEVTNNTCVFFRAEDNVGNISTQMIGTFVVDSVPPSVNELKVNGEETTLSKQKHIITLKANDGVEPQGGADPAFSGIQQISWVLKNESEEQIKSGNVYEGDTARKIPENFDEINGCRTAEAKLEFGDKDGLKDGKYYVEFKIIDFCGNENTDTKSAPFVIDTEAPKAWVNVNGSDGVNGKNYYYKSLENITVHFEDINLADKIEDCTAKIVDSQGIEKASKELESGTEIVFTGLDLKEETYTVIVNAKDSAGNEMTSLNAIGTGDKDSSGAVISGKNATFIVDKTAPTASITMDGGVTANTDGHFYYKADNLTNITVNFADDNIADNYKAKDVDVTTYGYYAQLFNSTGSEIAKKFLAENATAIIFDETDLSSLPDDTYSVIVFAKDYAGNAASSLNTSGIEINQNNKLSASFVLDKTVPTAWVTIGDGKVSANNDGKFYYRAETLTGIVVNFADDNIEKSLNYNGYTAKITDLSGNVKVAEVMATKQDDGIGVVFDAATLSELTDGEYKVEVSATDVAGNAMTALNALDSQSNPSAGAVISGLEASFVVDKTVPTAWVTIGEGKVSANNDGKFYYRAETLTEIVVNFEDDNIEKSLNYNGYSAKITDLSGNVKVAEVIATKQGGDIGVVFDAYTLSKLTDGEYKVEVSATDVAGNAMTALNALDSQSNPSAGAVITGLEASFVVDKTAPKISFDISDYTPIYDSDKTPLHYFGQTKTIGVSIGETGSGLKRTQYAFLTSAEATAIGGDYAKIDNDRFINNDAAFEDGKYNFEVTNNTCVFFRAEDNAGNISTQMIGTFVVDSVAPSINELKVNGEATTLSKQEHTITLKANDGVEPQGDADPAFSGIQQISWVLKDKDENVKKSGNVYEGDTARNIPKTFAEINGYRTAEASLTFGGDDGLPDGDYTVEITVTDFCGNSSTSDKTFYIDNTVPTAWVTISEGNVSANNDGKFYYRAETLTGIVVNFADEKIEESFNGESYDGYSAKITDLAGNVKVAEVMATKQDDGIGVVFDAATLSELTDGEYKVEVSATDVAGNAMTALNSIDAQTNPSAGAVITGLEASFVVDKTAPVVTAATITSTGSVNKDLQTFGSTTRYYFNDAFAVNFEVTENNFDTNALKVYSGKNLDATNYSTGVVTIDAASGVALENSNDNVWGKTLSVEKAGEDGLYIYNVAGTDKAGNKVVLDTQADFSKSIETEGIGSFTTFVIAKDTVAPEATVTMKDDEDFLIATYKRGEVAKYTVNNPYRQSTNATIDFVEDDYSPALINYKFWSKSVDGEEKNNYIESEHVKFIKDNTESEIVSGERIISMTGLTVTDCAGNTTTGNANKIYFDITDPINDDNKNPNAGLTPITDAVSKVSAKVAEHRGEQETPLYDGDVKITANIFDPHYDTSSSGLYQTHFTVYVNGQKENTSDAYEVYFGEGFTYSKEDGTVTYNSNRNHKPAEGESVIDDTLLYSDLITFEFMPKDVYGNSTIFDSNNITLKVWAEDNSGNVDEESAATYTFGIDATAPIIDVVYDNNDVANENYLENGHGYFKAPRTATITVTERNFDPTMTNVITEIDHSEWTWNEGTDVNGNNDKWVCTVIYDKDGDYTLGIDTTDLVGRFANDSDAYGNQPAPKSFTIDLIDPVIQDITFDNNSVQNGKYYKDYRTATITIVEHNFRASDAKVVVDASIQRGSVSTPVESAWTSDGDVHTATIPFKEDGNYAIKVNFTDLSSREAVEKTVEEFVVDTTEPTLSCFINGENVDIDSSKAYNKDVVLGITYDDTNYDSTSPGITITGKVHEDVSHLNGSMSTSEFGGSYTCDNIPVLKSNDDIYIAVGSIKDMAGNEKSGTFMFSVNRFGSTFMIDENDAGTVAMRNSYTNNPTNVRIIEVNVNAHESEEVSLKANDNISVLTHNDYTVTSSTPGWTQYTYEISKENFDADGEYAITVTSVDAAGNNNSSAAIQGDDGVSEFTYEFYVDRTNPTITISGIENNGRYSDNTREVAISVNDNSYVGTVVVTPSNGEELTYTAQELVDMNYEISYTATAANSWQKLTVTAKDAAGNEYQSESVEFLLTSNIFVQFFNNTPLFVGSLVVIAAIVVGAVVLSKKKKENK